MRPGGSPGFLYFRLSLRFARGLCARSLGSGWLWLWVGLLLSSQAFYRPVGGWLVVGGWMVGLKRTALRRVCAALLCTPFNFAAFPFCDIPILSIWRGIHHAIASYFCPALPAYVRYSIV